MTLAVLGVWCSLAAYVIAVVLTCGWFLAGRRRLRRRAERVFPALSILKPLSGLDDDLEANLESFAAADYPQLQIIFCAIDPQDPAIDVARRVAARHPQRDILIMWGRKSAAANPKVANLERMLPHARYDLCLLSDSNVRLAPGDLAELVAAFDDRSVGLVYQPVAGVGETTPAATVENLRFTEYSGMLTIFVRLVAGHDIVTGKGILVRQRALRDIGGLSVVRDTAADDYLLCRAVKRAGWKLVLAPVPARTVHSKWSFGNVIRRHARHAGMRWRLSPWTYVLELTINPIFLAGLVLATGGLKNLGLFCTVVAVKTALEMVSAAVLRRARPRLAHALLIPFKDLLMSALWFAAIGYRRVHWRGQTYSIHTGARLVPIPQPATYRKAA
jgi:ceramide glucosyltransferase